MLSNEECFTFVKIMIKNISLICQTIFYYTALWNTALFLDFFFPSFPPSSLSSLSPPLPLSFPPNSFLGTLMACQL